MFSYMWWPKNFIHDMWAQIFIHELWAHNFFFEMWAPASQPASQPASHPAIQPLPRIVVTATAWVHRGSVQLANTTKKKLSCPTPN